MKPPTRRPARAPARGSARRCSHPPCPAGCDVLAQARRLAYPVATSRSRSMRSQVLTLCVSLMAGVTAPAAPATPTEFPAEKLRKALDQPRELDIAGEALIQAVDKLSRQTDIPFRLDPALPSVGMGFSVFPALTIRAARQKVGVVLRQELAAHGLAHVIVGDKVLITT